VKIGYARCSTTDQDLTVQREQLRELGAERIYTDHGMTGANRDRPGLREALAAVREGDTLIVAKLDRLARSLPDARSIISELTKGGVKFQLGATVHDPEDPLSALLVNVLSLVSEFEHSLLRTRTREGMENAKKRGRLQGKRPKLKPLAEAHLMRLSDAGEHTVSELAELFSISRGTVYRARERAARRTGCSEPGA
jgi:DNA invertase Pin-like site-specific DNA recombinase